MPTGNERADTREARYVVAPERMPPLTREQMTDAQRATAAELEAGPRGSVRGPYNSILRSPGFMEHCQKLGGYVRFDCPHSSQ